MEKRSWKDRLAGLSNQPAGTVGAEANRILEALETIEPDDEFCELIANNAVLFGELALSEPLDELLTRWSGTGVNSEAISRARAILASHRSPPRAVGHLRAMGDAPGVLEVINDVIRGAIESAVKIGESHDGFLKNTGEANAVAYLSWAYVLLRRFDDAGRLLQGWRSRHPNAEASFDLAILRAEAMLARYRMNFHDEEALLQAALGRAEAEGLTQEAATIETALVSALARLGDLDRAGKRVQAWTEVDEETQLAGRRARARMDLALLRGDAGAAWTHAEPALEFVKRVGNVWLETGLHFSRVLAAPEAAAQEALSAFRHIVGRHPSPLFATRLKQIETLTERGCPSSRQLQLRSRNRSEPIAPARLWIPTASALQADLYFDSVLRRLFVRGTEIELPDSVPAKVLDALLTADGFQLEVAQLFSQVWESDYNPAGHENRVQVNLHRVRQWLEPQLPGKTTIIEVRESTIRLADGLNVQVLT